MLEVNLLILAKLVRLLGYGLVAVIAFVTEAQLCPGYCLLLAGELGQGAVTVWLWSKSKGQAKDLLHRHDDHFRE
jgi:hypothetical protein